MKFEIIKYCMPLEVCNGSHARQEWRYGEKDTSLFYERN